MEKVTKPETQDKGVTPATVKQESSKAKARRRRQDVDLVGLMNAIYGTLGMSDNTQG